jgi:hypothetical protein
MVLFCFCVLWTAGARACLLLAAAAFALACSGWPLASLLMVLLFNIKGSVGGFVRRRSAQQLRCALHQNRNSRAAANNSRPEPPLCSQHRKESSNYLFCVYLEKAIKSKWMGSDLEVGE